MPALVKCLRAYNAGWCKARDIRLTLSCRRRAIQTPALRCAAASRETSAITSRCIPPSGWSPSDAVGDAAARAGASGYTSRCPSFGCSISTRLLGGALLDQPEGSTWRAGEVGRLLRDGLGDSRGCANAAVLHDPRALIAAARSGLLARGLRELCRLLFEAAPPNFICRCPASSRCDPHDLALPQAISCAIEPHDHSPVLLLPDGREPACRRD